MSAQSREELLLENILGASHEVIPQSRVEILLSEVNDSINQRIGDKVAEETGDWLDENLATPSTPPVDPTLTISNAAADSQKTGNAINSVRRDLRDFQSANPVNVLSAVSWEQGSIDASSGADMTSTTRIRTIGYIPVMAGDRLHFEIASGYKFVVDFFSSAFSVVTVSGMGGLWKSESMDYVIPNNVAYIRMLVATTGNGTIVATEASNLTVTRPVKYLPVSVDWVADKYVNYTDGKFYDNTAYKYCTIPIAIFRGGRISGVTGLPPNSTIGIALYDENDNYISGIQSTYTGHYDFSYSIPIPQNASFLRISLRNASADLWDGPYYPWDVAVKNINTAIKNGKAEELNRKVQNARHIKGDSATPLTLLHFSDLHADKDSLARIMGEAKNLYNIDGSICTGDMCSNTYGEIAEWWDESVMTAIGNHDTASYDSGTGYNWTALSMANRIAYYISPFESNWGITRPSGKDYYYKDYSTQKVRLIVLDGMLYVSGGTDATDQTTWLANLLADAKTNGLHVLIAIHSPHGGATAKECSFSKVGQGTMPVNADCNTPQTVVDTVATAIAAGTHFVGYLVGHTHQDNILDVENDGKQLMYCVTCANTSSKPQWVNSDQHRGIGFDAYNIVTIDTANTLVKIVRAGGADIDDHMRTRKAICFDYSTGEKVGEVL